jgi:two-component system, chemotaxis family, response regulator Rcp1
MNMLLVDDNQGDIILLQEAMDKVGVKRTSHIVRDGQSAVDFLLKTPPYADAPQPDLIVMDLRLPALSGIEVMQQFHHRPEYRKIPMVLLSGMVREEGDCCGHWDRSRCLYLVKPMDFDGYVEAVVAIQEFLGSLCGAEAAPGAS